MPRMAELRGMRFGRIFVVSMTQKRAVWNCLCDCGKELILPGCALLTGNTRSCGCYKKDMLREKLTKHGHASEGVKTSEYNCLREIIQRCSNPNVKQYMDYGGRGITVCERWLHSFENFLEDMGNKPSPKHSIERMNNDGNYEPSNCKWATKYEQAQNKRMYKSNTSGIQGVKWDKKESRWIAQITTNGVRIRLGAFKEKEKAMEARQQAEKEYRKKLPS